MTVLELKRYLDLKPGDGPYTEWWNRYNILVSIVLLILNRHPEIEEEVLTNLEKELK